MFFPPSSIPCPPADTRAGVKETIATGTRPLQQGAWNGGGHAEHRPAGGRRIDPPRPDPNRAAGRCVRTGASSPRSRGVTKARSSPDGELRDAGALGFTDDGWPVVSAGMLRKALQYQRLCGGVLALHEEDPALSAGGVMHEGAISARLGLAGIPSISESTMISRDARPGAYEGGARALPTSFVCAVAAGARDRRRARRAARSATT